MSIEIKVPALPESVSDATVSKWHKKPGEAVVRDETLVDIETDKVVLEVPAPESGVLEVISKEEGTTVGAAEIIGTMKAETTVEAIAEVNGTITARETAPEPVENAVTPQATSTVAANTELSPAVRRLVSERSVDVSNLRGSGKEGRILKEDVEKYIEQARLKQASLQATQQQKPEQKATPTPKPSAEVVSLAFAGERPETRVPMTRLRARIAERLLGAQQNMALLTTFNEINMQAVMDLRKQYKEKFEKEHQVRLGFMSFFVKATVTALKRFPDVNAFIDGNDIVYHGYCDIGVAVSTDRGLVVPVVRNADKMSMADMERQISEFATKGRENKLTLEDLTGGTFSITNGGVFGSLLATPIVNPPQSAILGMHKIEQRPIAENGQVVIRPMMYIALSYDHRIIDGKGSIQFLQTVKELIEDPARLLLDV